MTDMVDPATEEFHVLSLAGTMFFIDKDTRREIEAFLSHVEHPWDTLTVDDLTGAEVLVVADAVNGIWSTTAEIREKDRAMRKVLETEENLS